MHKVCLTRKNKSWQEPVSVKTQRNMTLADIKVKADGRGSS